MVARLTGISADTLRAWEQRYGVVKPSRSAGGGRVYSSADVERLRLVKRLAASGRSIGDIAALRTRDMERLLAAQSVDRPTVSETGGDAIVERFLGSLAVFDLVSARRELERAAVALAPAQSIARVVLPIMVAIGERWESGKLCVSHEHAAAAMMRTHLGNLLLTLPADPGAPSVVCATPGGERHELGALVAAIFAGLAGWRPVYLGPDLPSSEIAIAVARTRASSVLLSIVSLPAARARGALATLRQSLPQTTALIVGGSRAAEAARGIAGVEVESDVSAVGRRLASTR